MNASTIFSDKVQSQRQLPEVSAANKEPLPEKYRKPINDEGSRVLIENVKKHLASGKQVPY